MKTRTLRIFSCAALLALGLPLAAGAQVSLRNFELKAHFNDYPPVPGSPFGAGYASCWSYVHEDGREYAIIGVTDGAAIYNVTDPDNAYFVAHIPGPVSAWHEMKSYRNWIYVVTEAAGGGSQPAGGVQIIRMTDPENPVVAATYSATLTRAHTVSIDSTRALLYVNGTNGGGWNGVRILSLASPEAPVEVGFWGSGSSTLYAHDTVPIGNRLYVSSIYSGIQRILDVTNPAAPFELASWTYPGETGPNGAFTHNAWPDATGNYLYVTDEVGSEPLKIFDISNLASPVLVNSISSNPEAIVHNAHVDGDNLHLANYTEGIRVLDISDPAHPAEWGYADSYPGQSGGFFGVWESCPYFPSGTVIASDMQTGLYVYRMTPDYGILRAEVVDAATQLPMEDVPVFLTTQGDSLETPSDGIVRFAPNPGSHTVAAKLFGYDVAQASRTVSVGSRDTFKLEMVLKPISTLSGTMRDAATLSALNEASFDLAYTPLATSTNAAGQYSLVGIPDDIYRIEVRRAGYIPVSVDRAIGPSFPPVLDFDLTATATWDDLESASGWTVGAPGDNATTGVWERVDPIGTGVRTNGPSSMNPDDRRRPGLLHETLEPAVAPGDIQPEFDNTPAPGTLCFVTGQGISPTSPGQNDVDNGWTSLTTPDLDVTGMTNPMISYFRWFYASGDENDWLATLISNDGGSSWVPVDTLRGTENQWVGVTVRVLDYVTATDEVRLRFVAADDGSGSLVEAGVDDLTTFDGTGDDSAVRVGDALPTHQLRFGVPRPNPSRGVVHLSLQMPRAGDVDVSILDLMGRQIATLHRGAVPAGQLALRWDGRDRHGNAVPDGVYYARAKAGAEKAVTRFVRMR